MNFPNPFETLFAEEDRRIEDFVKQKMLGRPISSELASELMGLVGSRHDSIKRALEKIAGDHAGSMLDDLLSALVRFEVNGIACRIVGVLFKPSDNGNVGTIASIHSRIGKAIAAEGIIPLNAVHDGHTSFALPRLLELARSKANARWGASATGDKVSSKLGHGFLSQRDLGRRADNFRVALFVVRDGSPAFDSIVTAFPTMTISDDLQHGPLMSAPDFLAAWDILHSAYQASHDVIGRLPDFPVVATNAYERAIGIAVTAPDGAVGNAMLHVIDPSASFDRMSEAAFAMVETKDFPLAREVGRPDPRDMPMEELIALVGDDQPLGNVIEAVEQVFANAGKRILGDLTTMTLEDIAGQPIMLDLIRNRPPVRTSLRDGMKEIAGLFSHKVRNKLKLDFLPEDLTERVENAWVQQMLAMRVLDLLTDDSELVHWEVVEAKPRDKAISLDGGRSAVVTIVDEEYNCEMENVTLKNVVANLFDDAGKAVGRARAIIIRSRSKEYYVDGETLLMDLDAISAGHAELGAQIADNFEEIDEALYDGVVVVVEFIAVRKEERRKGHGRALMDILLQQAKPKNRNVSAVIIPISPEGFHSTVTDKAPAALQMVYANRIAGIRRFCDALDVSRRAYQKVVFAKGLPASSFELIMRSIGVHPNQPRP